MNKSRFYAHSTENSDKSDWQTLENHLQGVADLAEEFAGVFGAGDWGLVAGRLHDAGKAVAAFQRRLEGSSQRVDHSSFGARLAKENAGQLGLLLSYVIAGHHGGLPDGGMQETELHYRLKHKVPPDVSPPSMADIEINLLPPFKTLDEKRIGFSLAFFTRMILFR